MNRLTRGWSWFWAWWDRHWRKVFFVWVLVVTLFIIYGAHENRARQNEIHHEANARVDDLAQAGRERFAEVQRSRIISCKTTYRTLRQFARASVGGRHLSREQKKQYSLFLKNSDPKRCEKQTHVPKIPNPLPGPLAP